MRKVKSISEETKRAILESAWELIAGSGRADIALAEIAARAGVSRQTIFYAFGSRSALLVAMVRHKDAMTGHVARIRAVLAEPEPRRDSLVRLALAWLDYLPVIYPVGILLDAAALTDPDAAAAWDDRMIRSLLAGFRRHAASVHARDALPGTPQRVADEIWALVHPSMWRRLVVECGWSAEAFRGSQSAAIRRLLRLPEEQLTP